MPPPQTKYEMASTNPAKNPKLPSTEPTKPSNTQQQDTLGEDDEFEDFPVENWTAAESDISTLAIPASHAKQATAEGAPKKATMDDLWEDNWDDDVIESDFAHQLRAELEKTKANGAGPAPMQT